MEQCMRLHPSTRVGIDALLIKPKDHGVHLAAVYWSSPVRGFPVVHERHFVADAACDTVSEVPVTAPTEWSSFAWKITPDGSLKKLI
jgi:hypothetical protein